jgi:hypothetical protein
MPVHQHFAGDEAQRTLPGLAHQRVDGAGVHRAEYRRRRDALAQVLVEIVARDFAREPRIAERRLRGKRVALEPVEQCGAVAAGHRQLRIVDVAIDEPRQHQTISRQRLDRRSRRQRALHRGGRSRGDDAAVRHRDDRIRFVRQRALRADDEGVAAPGDHRAAQRDHGLGRRMGGPGALHRGARIT